LSLARAVGRRALRVSIALVLLSARAAAQDSALVDGAHIRIESADEKHAREGTFHALTADSLVYSPGLDTSKKSIALAQVNRIDVSRPNNGAGSVFKGAARGTLVGLGVTAGFIGACHFSSNDLCGVGAILAAPVFIGSGLLIGALLGSQVEGDHWTRVYPPDRRASLLIGPTSRGGFIVGLSVPFGSAPAN
jgi:hypothetical protein